MSEEIEKVAYDPVKTDLRGIRFTCSSTGHVHSPWFTYDYTEDLCEGRPVYGFGYGKLRLIIAAAAQAFAGVLNIPVTDVVVTEMPNANMGREFQWRLGTKGRCEVPAPPKAPTKKIREERDDVIDVEVTESTPRLK